LWDIKGLIVLRIAPTKRFILQRSDSVKDADFSFGFVVAALVLGDQR
jgi:hypothetical protein